jgi:hypothetical protein
MKTALVCLLIIIIFVVFPYQHCQFLSNGVSVASVLLSLDPASMTFDLSIISKDTMTFHAMMVLDNILQHERRDRFLFMTTALS